MLESDKAGGTCRCCAEPGGVWSLGPKMKQAGALGDGWIDWDGWIGMDWMDKWAKIDYGDMQINS